MLIWINGAWGSGKTQTAAELCRRTEHSFFYDPEEVGYCLRKTTPKALWHDDFQDNPLWRAMNITMLKKLCRDYDGVIVVPMTVMNKAYLNEILSALRADGAAVQHFTLIASEQTIYKRLRKRFEGKNSWAGRRAKDCVTAFLSPVFETKIETDEITISQAAEEIAKKAGLALLPRDRALKRQIRRLKTQLNAINK
ncbi:AAA family ATPase [Congzhengia sp.]|uniref:AAA family ATPase n=1 Tax=Congzhengia sp. TaxID=2944168 RepID=UPI00307897F3